MPPSATFPLHSTYSHVSLPPLSLLLSSDPAKTPVPRPLTEYNEITSRFPKVLWVLVGTGGIEGLPMVQSLVAQHQVRVGRDSGWEVRVVTTLTAYDWLSPASA